MIRFSTLDYDSPSEYPQDLQMKYEGLVLWQAFRKGLPRQQMVVQHKYSLLGTQLVAAWTALQTQWLRGKQTLSRSDFTAQTRFFMVLSGLLFIVSACFLGETPSTRWLCGALACLLFLPFLFSLMTRPHLLNLAFLTAALAAGASVLKTPNRLRITLFGFLSGLSISIMTPSAIILWWGFFVLKEKKLLRFSWWLLAGLVVGLIPGYIDTIILWAHPQWEPLAQVIAGQVDWKSQIKYHPLGFNGMLTFLKTFVGHDPVLLGGLFLAAFYRLKSTLLSSCWKTIVPFTILLLAISDAERFWLFIYPFYLVVASAGWRAWLMRTRKPLWIWSLMIFACLGLQLRTAWLMGHDTRPPVERNILGMLPENSILLLDGYGPRFNNYTSHEKFFKVIETQNIQENHLKEIQNSDVNVFYLANSATPDNPQLKNQSLLIKSWVAQGKAHHTQDLPNKIAWPWWSVWQRSQAGPDCYLYLVPPQVMAHFSK